MPIDLIVSDNSIIRFAFDRTIFVLDHFNIERFWAHHILHAYCGSVSDTVIRESTFYDVLTCDCQVWVSLESVGYWSWELLSHVIIHFTLRCLFVVVEYNVLKATGFVRFGVHLCLAFTPSKYAIHLTEISYRPLLRLLDIELSR